MHVVWDRHTKAALALILFAAGYRFALVLCFGPGPDEAFYWEWTRFDRPALGYVEHPPLAAYIIRLMSLTFGAHAWAWRIPAVLMGAASCCFMFLAARVLFSSRAGFWTAVAYLISPLYSMAAGSLLIPETLLTFWITLALYLSAKLVVTGDLQIFLILGVVLGGGLLSKLPAVLIPAALGLFLLLSPDHRHWFRKPQPYLMLLIALLIFSPVLYWNWTHDWIGLQFVAQRTAVKEQVSQSPLQLTWQSLLGQAGYHSPLLYLFLWVAGAAATWRAWAGRDERYLLLACFSVPVMLLFQLVAGLRFTLPHWPAAGYLAAYVALAGLLTERAGLWSTARRLAITSTVLLGALITALSPIALLVPLTTLGYHALQSRVGSPRHVIEPMAHCAGWGEEIRDGLVAARRRATAQYGTPPVVLTHFHMLAAILAYHLRDECEVLSIHAQAHQYDLWYDDEDLTDQPVLFVSSTAFLTSSGEAGQPLDYYKFRECAEQQPIIIIRCGVEINRVHLWLCTGYTGPADTPGPQI